MYSKHMKVEEELFEIRKKKEQEESEGDKMGKWGVNRSKIFDTHM